jgi:hypothetical protein
LPNCRSCSFSMQDLAKANVKPVTTMSISSCLANELGIYLILAIQEKITSNSNQLGKNRNLAKLISPRRNIHATIWVGMHVGRWKKRIERGICKFFQDVKGYKHNFVSLMVPDVSLDLDMTSTLYQIVGDEFFYLTYLFRSWQNTICQVKFGKLLEMLSTS